MENSRFIKSDTEPSISEYTIANYKRHLQKKLSEISLSEDAVRDISMAFQIRMHKKGTILLKPGEKATDCLYILKGCVKEFYLINGEKRTTFFHTEGEIIVSLTDAAKKVSRNHYLRCAEDTTVAAISFEKVRELYEKYPEFETLSRSGIEDRLDVWQDMLANYILSTPEKRYLEIMKSRPELMSRITRDQLASHIGVKPETLGKIRRRIMARTAKTG